MNLKTCNITTTSHLAVICAEKLSSYAHHGCHVGGIKQTLTEVAVAMSSATFIPVIRASEFIVVPARLAEGIELCVAQTGIRCTQSETRHLQQTGAGAIVCSL